MPNTTKWTQWKNLQGRDLSASYEGLHLRSGWEEGIQTGGFIQYVWLFGIVGIFVLLLACINFMNLSTARSEQRAKEVGIRKSIGSVRNQLIAQFLSESFLVVILAFVLAVLLVYIAMPWFNQLADKKMIPPVTNPTFWMISIGFIMVTGFLAGSYPALYLSSFQPVKVLKGTFRTGPVGLGSPQGIGGGAIYGIGDVNHRNHYCVSANSVL